MDAVALTPRRVIQIIRSSSRADPFWPKAKVLLAPHVEHFKPKDLWRTTLCFAESSHLDHHFSDLLSRGFQQADYGQLSCNEMAQLATAITQQDNDVGLNILSYVGMVFTMRAQEAKPEAIVTVAEAFAQAGIADVVLFQQLAAASMVTLGAYKMGEIIRLLLCFSMLQIEHEALFLKAVTHLMKPWEPEELAHIAFAYARFYLAVPEIRQLLIQRTPEAIPRLSTIQQLELIVSLDRLEVLNASLSFTLEKSYCSTSLLCKAAGALLPVRQTDSISELLGEAWSRDDYTAEDKMQLFYGLSHYKTGWMFDSYPLSFFLDKIGEMSMVETALAFKAVRNLPPSHAKPFVPDLHRQAKCLLGGRISEDYATSLKLSSAMCGHPIDSGSDDERVRFFAGLQTTEEQCGNGTIASRDLCAYLGAEYSSWQIGPYRIDARGPAGCFVFIWPQDFTHEELSFEARGKLERFKQYGPVTEIYYDKWRKGWRPPLTHA